MKSIYKKILTGVFILLFAFIFKIPGVGAASCRINVSAPSSVIVGQSFKVTVNVSSNASLGSWEYTLSYDSSKVRLSGGTLHVVDYGNGSKNAASYSYTFTALTSGTATFKPVNASVLDYTSTNECLTGSSSASVTMKTQAQIEASYSKNNNLASLSVEGAELTPVFNASVTEYSATLPADTTKAVINAAVADKTATVSGTGEKDVVDGLNKLEVVVTAQNGSKKTYVINLTVEELEPISVKVDGKSYTVVRKNGMVQNVPFGFSETKIKIDGQEVTAYKSEVTKLTLVALKDEEGTIKLFIYNGSKKEFSAFNEAKGSGTNLLILKNANKEVPEGFVKTTFKYNKVDVDGYKLKDANDGNHYLVYAQNLETGSEDYYLYDKKDNTFQRFFSDLISVKDERIKIMEYIIIGLFVPLAIILLILIIRWIKAAFTSKEKKIKKYQKKINKLGNKKSEAFFEVEDINVKEEPVVKKIREDDFVVPKKSRKDKAKELEEARKRLERTKPSFRRVSLEDDDDD